MGVSVYSAWGFTNVRVTSPIAGDARPSVFIRVDRNSSSLYVIPRPSTGLVISFLVFRQHRKRKGHLFSPTGLRYCEFSTGVYGVLRGVLLTLSPILVGDRGVVSQLCGIPNQFFRLAAFQGSLTYVGSRGSFHLRVGACYVSTYVCFFYDCVFCLRVFGESRSRRSTIRLVTIFS